jgi:MFS family permease
MAAVISERSFLSTRRGMFTLVLLCTVQFMDIVDSSIMNVALPSIRTDLGFSQQRLQWVLSGYLVTYGGFLLLGGRAADLIGRRRMLVAGTALFAVCSLAGGLATNSGTPHCNSGPRSVWRSSPPSPPPKPTPCSPPGPSRPPH